MVGTYATAGGGYDSFTGPTLHLRPEELDRLDASQLDPLTEGASGLEPYRRMESSIQGTLAAFGSSSRPQSQALTYSAATDRTTSANPLQPASSVGGNAMTSPVIAPRPQPIMNFTPPSSNNQEGKDTGPTFGTRFEYAETAATTTTTAGGGERFYRENIRKLQADLDEMITHHKRVVSHWEEMERGLQSEISAARKELERERDGRESEKTRYSRLIRDLRSRIRELEDQLETQRSRRSARSVSFALSDEEEGGDDSDDYLTLEEDCQRQRDRRRATRPMADGRLECERRLVQVKKEHDSKVASLVRQFEKEKAAALEILKSKIRAEVSLLIPQIKERYQRAYEDRVESVRASTASQIKSQYEERLQRIREDHAMERRVWQRQAREQIERERRDLAKRLKAKYEMRLMDIENECERRILARVRQANGTDRRRGGHHRHLAEGERPGEEDSLIL